MRIACLPIDSRPCNTQFVREITDWAGGECVLPAQEEMDDFRRPAPFEGSLAFLERELPRCGALVISLDHWCYGGLLASREEGVSLEQARERVRILRDMLGRCPNTPVYMSTVVLRSSISTLSSADLDAYAAMTDYSVAADRFERFGLARDKEKMEEARLRVPPALLEKTLRVRQRNAAVNLSAVDLAAEGYVSSLSVLQEDCQVYGLPRKDQRRIEQRIRETGAKNVFLRNGTDEAGALSAAQALLRAAGSGPVEAQIMFLGPQDFVAPYEDRPFRANLESACRECGVAARTEAKTALLVCCPRQGEQKEASCPVEGEWLSFCAGEADKLIRQGKRVYLLDVMRSNGGAAGLLSAMAAPDGLWGYSAWNTASNAMGALLAQMISDHLRGAPNKRFFQERILDDYIYQTSLRPLLNEWLGGRGEDVYALRDKAGAEEALRKLYRERLPALWPLGESAEYTVSLPWGRTFEVKAEAAKTEEMP